MAETTRIQWTDHTFNIVWGCAKVSAGCEHCYAETFVHRFDRQWGGPSSWGVGGQRQVMSDKYWQQPLLWNKKAEATGVRRRVFCSSMADVFEDHATVAAEREKLWPLIRQTPYLDWLLLTKRSDRIANNLPSDWGAGYSNVWIGVSVENARYMYRLDDLREIPAARRFMSYEPALGPLGTVDFTGIHWLIIGGESGPGARRMDLQWADYVLSIGRAVGVSMFFKQTGSVLAQELGLKDKKGGDLTELPTSLQVRDWPETIDTIQ